MWIIFLVSGVETGHASGAAAGSGGGTASSATVGRGGGRRGGRRRGGSAASREKKRQASREQARATPTDGSQNVEENTKKEEPVKKVEPTKQEVVTRGEEPTKKEEKPKSDEKKESRPSKKEKKKQVRVGAVCLMGPVPYKWSNRKHLEGLWRMLFSQFAVCGCWSLFKAELPAEGIFAREEMKWGRPTEFREDVLCEEV